MPLQQGKPALGTEVTITLASGELLTAEWDGLQWWANLPNTENAAPIANQFVVGWQPLV